MKRKILIFSLVLIGMIAGASASLGSPSKVTVNSCSNFFDDCSGSEKVIVMEWTDDSFDSSSVTVSAEEISSKLDTGKVKNSFSMRITGSQSKAKYNIRDGGTPDLYGVDAITNKWTWCQTSVTCGGDYPSYPGDEASKEDMKEWAKQNSYDLNEDGQTPYVGRRWTTGLINDIVNGRAYALARGSKYANVGDISTNPREVMATTFEVGGIEKTLSNSDIGQGKTANFGGQVKINFKGGLESGYNFPIPDDSLVVYNDNRFNGFRIVKKDAIQSDYDSFLGSIEDLETLRNWRDDGGTNEEGIESRAKNKLEQVTQEYSQSELKDHNYEISGDSIQSGTITVKGNQQYSYPTFQVWIKGDKLQYVIPDATPKIASVSAPDEMKEGNPGTISVRVKNSEDATGKGDFSVSVKDTSSGFNWNGISKDVNLAPGEATTVDLSISYGEDSDQKRNSGTATIQVKNLRDTSETVTREVSLTGVQSNNCEPGSYSVTYNDDGTKTISKCNSDGQTKEKVATCGAEERVKNLSDGTKTCVDKSSDLKEKCGDNVDNDGDGKIDENCNEGGNQSDDGTKKVWIPTQGGSRCISQVVDTGTTLDPSFSSKSKCENSLQGNVGCAIVTPDFVPFTESEEFSLICGENKVYANVLLTLLIGLIGVQTGRRIGGVVDPDDEDEPQTATLILATGLGVIGAVVGFLFISVAQAIGFILVAGLIYLIYKGVMYYTGAEAVKDLITG